MPKDEWLDKAEILSIDLGWKAPEELTRKKRRSKLTLEAGMDLGNESIDSIENAKVQSSFS